MFVYCRNKLGGLGLVGNGRLPDGFCDGGAELLKRFSKQCSDGLYFELSLLCFMLTKCFTWTSVNTQAPGRGHHQQK